MDEVGHEDAGKGRSELVAMRGRVEAGQRRSGEGEKADDSTNAAWETCPEFITKPRRVKFACSKHSKAATRQSQKA